MSSKRNKKYGKICPDCGAEGLHNVIFKKNKSGILFDEIYEKCNNCGYSERIKKRKKQERDDLE